MSSLHEYMDDPKTYEEGLAKAEQSLAKGGSLFEMIQAKAAIVWFLSHLDRDINRVMTLCGEIEAAYTQGCDPEIIPYVAAAMNNKGWLLAWKQRDNAAAVAIFQRAFEQFGTHPNPLVQAKAMGALVNNGWLLREEGRYDEAIAAFDQVSEALADRIGDTALRAQYVNAMVNKAQTLFRLDKKSDSRVIAIDVLKRFGSEKDVELEEALEEAVSLLSAA